MTNYFSQEIIDKVRQASDLIQVASEFLSLKKTGNNFQTLCPFHPEKTPSFFLSPSLQIYKCFGCGKAGNVFSFLMEIKTLSFPEAVVELAKKCNVPIPEIEAKGVNKEKKNLLEILQWATLFFVRQLKLHPGASEYLKNRKLSQEIIEKFQLGFAPVSTETMLEESIKAQIPTDMLEKTGLIVKHTKHPGKYLSRFHNRIIFPIHNVSNEVIAFGGRVISSEEEPKYLNSPDSNLFSKGKTLYGLPFARSFLKENNSAIITEGYVDVLMAHQYNFQQTVGTLGTALREEHVKIIKRYANSAILTFDGDRAGQLGMDRALPHFLRQGLQIKLAILPEKLDPCDFLLQKGKEAFQGVLNQSSDVLEFFIEQLKQKHDFTSMGGRRVATLEFSKLLSHIPDQLVRDMLVARIAKQFNYTVEYLQSELNKNQKSLPKEVAVKLSEQFPKYQNFQNRDEEFLLWVCLHYPGKKVEILEFYSPQDFQNKNLAKLAQEIALATEESLKDIARFSSQLESTNQLESNELVTLLINIYTIEQDVIDWEQIEQRIHLIFKSFTRKQLSNKYSKIRELENKVSPEDEDFRNKLLGDGLIIKKNFTQYW